MITRALMRAARFSMYYDPMMLQAVHLGHDTLGEGVDEIAPRA